MQDEGKRRGRMGTGGKGENGGEKAWRGKRGEWKGSSRGWGLKGKRK